MVLSASDTKIAWQLQHKWGQGGFFSDSDQDELRRLMDLENEHMDRVQNMSQKIQTLKSWLVETASEKLGWNEWAI